MINKLNRKIKSSRKFFGLLFNKEDGRKRFPSLVCSMLQWILIEKIPYQLFYLYGLHLKGSNRKDFILNKDYRSTERKFRPVCYNLMEDKFRFAMYLKAMNVPAAVTFATYDKGMFNYIDVPESIDLKTFVKTDRVFYLKGITGCSGEQVHFVKTESGKLYVDGRKSSLHYFSKKVPEKAILQYPVTQVDEMSRFNADCVNTLRIATILGSDGPEVFSVFLRMGRLGSFVDNVGQEGIFVGVEKDTGVLYDFGYSEREPLAKYYSHPDTKTEFKGFSIPQYQQAIDLALDAHKRCFFDFFSIGWDVALTPEGPVVIEANYPWYWHINQVTDGPLKENYLQYAKQFSRKK